MNPYKLIILVLLQSINISSLYSQTIIINEFCSSNESILIDNFGNSSDWIELYNNNNQPVNLLNYALSDDSNELRKWILPEVIIPAHNYLIIFASGNTDTNELHTNFKIKQSGEAIYLTDNNHSIVSTMPAVYVLTNKSYGCITDANHFKTQLHTPTPGYSNSNSNSIYNTHSSGNYNSVIRPVLIPANGSGTIYYTLNGNTPTSNDFLYTDTLNFTNKPNINTSYNLIPTTPLEGPSHLLSFIWKEPKSVFKTNTLRYAIIANDTIQSDVYSKTYFVNSEHRYSFPIISLVTDSLNLFDYETGIYIPGKRFDQMGFNWWPEGNYLNGGMEWERPAHLSYFDANGELAFKTKVGLRMHGNGSTAYPQKSLRVYFRKEYGTKNITYPIFEKSTTNTYKRLILRNSGNDFIYTHFRDALLQELIKPLGLELQNSQPSILFINGEYWGIHNIREKFDAHHFANHFNLEKDDVNILSICGDLEEGDNTDFLDLMNFITSNDISIDTNYDIIKQKIDIPNFINSQLAEIYIANYDWPCNNYKIWKSNSPDSKWRFLIYDLDLSFGYHENSTVAYNSLEHSTNFNQELPGYCECTYTLFKKLLENDEFKSEFIDALTFHLQNTFTPKKVIDLINKYEELYSVEIEEHINRWNYPQSKEHWVKEIDILREFALDRPCYLSQDIKQYFELNELELLCDTDDEIGINTISVSPNPSQGHIILKNNSILDLDEINVSVINVLGQVDYSYEISNLNSMESTTLNLTDLSNGIYLLLLNKKNKSEYTKIIINKY